MHHVGSYGSLQTFVRGGIEHICGCFPTGRHYPGLAERIAATVVTVHGVATEYESSHSWSTLRVAVVDFETTGLDPEKDRIIEVGVVCFDGGEIVLSKNWLVDPGMAISSEVSEVTGITADMLVGAPKLEAVFAEFLMALEGRIPVAYNADFDRRFLHAESKRIGMHHPESTKRAPALRSEVVWIDPLVWARELHKQEKSRRLADVAARLGISLEQAHRAMHDAEAAGRVLYALAPQMPRTYGELVRLQGQYAARQGVDSSMLWRTKRSN